MNIFFDLDGTIIDSRNRLFSLFCDLTKQNILDIDDYWELKRSMYDHEFILKTYCNYSDEQVTSFNISWINKIETRKYLSKDILFPFTIEVLQELTSNKTKIYLVTARQSTENTRSELSELGIDQFFSNIFITNAQMNKSIIIRNFNIPITRKDLFVGDTGIDMQAGKELGITTVAVLSGFRNRSMLKKYNPEFIIDDIRSLLNFTKE